jgi:N-acetylmuramic acid 6-phosphate etherase
MQLPGSDLEQATRLARDVDALGALETEQPRPLAGDLAERSTLELVELMNAEDQTVAASVRSASAAIAELVDATAARLRAGGRLIYVGAGSSGRIAALDAAECQSTFSTPAGTVVALVAGGVESQPLVQEEAEDDREAGAADVRQLAVSERDVVVGVSASGRTPYTLGAVEAASTAGALTACVVAVRGSELERIAQRAVVAVVGPEFLAGSTRLKAGTAQKLVLNTLSTLAMVRLGKTYGNLMVDVAATNAKLRARVRRIVQTATGASAGEVEDALAAADGNAKVAIVSLLARVAADEARRRLDASGGDIAGAVRT